MPRTAAAHRTLTVRLLGAALATALAIAQLPPVPAHATDPDPRVDDLVAGLRAWGRALDRAGELGPLAETIPLTVATPAMLAGLDAGLVEALVVEAATAPGIDDADDLLDALDGTTLSRNGLTATLTVTDRDTEAGSGDDVDFALDVEIERTVDVPLFYDEDLDGGDAGEVDGGPPTLFLRDGFLEFTVDAQGSFPFRLAVEPGPEEGDPDVHSFALNAPVAELTLGITAGDGDIGPFAARYGLTEADAAGAGTVALDFTVALVDPGASGTATITGRELDETDPLDLVEISIAGGAVDIALTLTQEALIGPGEQVTLSTLALPVAGTFPSDRDAFFPPVAEDVSDRFAPFATVEVEDVLVGLGEMALALRAAQFAADVHLPLLDGSLSDVVDPAGAVLDFTRQRSEALITCGSVDVSPPLGVPRPGGTAYCQAFTNTDPHPGSVAWSVDGDPVAGGDDTLGLSPTANVAVDTDDLDDLTVVWQVPHGDVDPEDPRGPDRRGVVRFDTVQALARALHREGFGGAADEDAAVAELLGLAQVAGLGGLDVVTLVLDRDLDEAAGLDWRVDDSLRPVARLSGVGGPAAPVTVTPSGGELTATFGIVLDPDVPRPQDDERLAADREAIEHVRGRFLLADGGEHLIRVDDLSASAGASLSGRIGYLPVDVALDLDLSTGTEPALLASLDATTVINGGSPSSSDVPKPDGSDGWARVIDLIGYLDPYAEDVEEAAIPPVRGFGTSVSLSLDAGATVTDGAGLSLSGGIDTAWDFDLERDAGDPTATAPELVIEPDAAYLAGLRPFDIAPEVSGVATGGTTTRLEATGTDFADAFGVADQSVVDATLSNLDKGASCRGFTIDGSALVCTDPLEELDNGGDPIIWEAGDRFVVAGDLTALRRVAMRALRTAAGGLAVSDNDTLTAALPLVDLTPAELLPHLVALADVLDALEGEAEGEGLTCFLDAAGTDCGDEDDFFAGGGTRTEAPAAPDLAALHALLTDRLGDGLDAHEELDDVFEGIALRVETLTRPFREDDETVGDPVAVPHLVFDLELADQAARTTDAALRTSHGEFGTIAEGAADGEGSLPVEHQARIRLAIGIPLADGFDARDAAILHTSGVTELTVDAERDDFDLKLLIGGVGVEGGTGTATVGGTHDGDDSATVLSDPDKDFADLGVQPGATLRLPDKAAGCTVGEVGVTTLTCQQPLAFDTPPPAPVFTTGAAYEIVDGDTAVASGTAGNYTDDAAEELAPARQLYDPAGDFENSGVEAGHVVRLLDGGDIAGTCVVESVTGTVVTCVDPLEAPGPVFEDGDAYETEAEGQAVVKLSAGFTLMHPLPGASRIPDFFTGIEGRLTGPRDGDVTCGTGDGATSGAACALLSLRRSSEADDGSGTALGTLRYEALTLDRVAEGSAPGNGPSPVLPHAQLPAGIAAALGLVPLDFVQVATGFRFVPDMLDVALDGTQTFTFAPLFGPNLDAGSGLIERIATASGALEDLGDDLEDALENSTDPEADAEAVIEAALAEVADELDDAGIDFDSDVEIDCSEPCDRAWHIDDIRIKVRFGEGSDVGIGCDGGGCTGEEEGPNLPVHVGAFGLPIELPEFAENPPKALASRYRWELEFSFGTSKSHGPYVDRYEDGDDSARLLLGARGSFASNASGCPTALPTRLGGYASGNLGLAFAGDRCADAFLGVLPGRVFDGDGSDDKSLRSASELLVEVLLVEGSRKDFGDLLDRRRVTVDVTSRARINLLFQTNAGTLFEDSDGKLPAIVGTFHALIDETGGSHFSYQHLAFDPGQFIADFVLPIAETIKDVTDPFMPVIEIVSTPIPIVTQLSELTGGGPVTMLTLLDAVTDNDLTMLERIIELIQMANRLAGQAVADDLFIPLGPEELTTPPVSDTPGGGDSDDALNIDVSKEGVVTIKGGGFEITISDPDKPDDDKQRRKDADAPKADKGNEEKAGKKKVTQKFDAKAEITGTALTFPVLDDPDEVFGMLLGRDAVLVRFDAGTLKAKVSLSWVFGPFAAGPVLFDVGIGGSIALEGRFALGYDTRGFTRTMRGQPAFISPFLDGLFIDDRDASGKDVDEVKLIVTISASAAVSIKILRAGLEGEVKFTISLDLIDHHGDGRVRIEDFYRFRHDPLCLFTAKGTLGFALKAFIEINLFIKKIKFSFTIWELKPPLTLFETTCTPPEPEFLLLDPGGVPGWATDWAGEQFDGGASVAVLTMGSAASQRGIFTDETDEVFMVSQRSETGGITVDTGTASQKARLDAQNYGSFSDGDKTTLIEIEAFGETRRYLVPENTVIYADTGTGTDTVRLDPGAPLPPDTSEGAPAAEEEEEHLFEHPAILVGGGTSDHRNRFHGGDGPNVLIGGTNTDDTLRGGRSPDIIFGRGGNNTIDGALNSNVLAGGTGDDLISGGPGSDLIIGVGGRNTLEGGPGLRPGSQPPGRDELVDTGNVIVGGFGPDTISGGPSTDYILAGGVPQGVHAGISGLTSAVEDFLRLPTAAGTSHVAVAEDARGWALGLLSGGTALNRQVAGALCTSDGDLRLDGDGTQGGNRVNGYRGDDLVMGGLGDDALDGGRGDDILCVRAGDNVLEANRGNNELHGGTGDDRLLGGPGDDWITGGGGHNLLDAGGGRNVLIGGASSDVLLGAQDGELLIGDGGPATGSPSHYRVDPDADGYGGFTAVIPGGGKAMAVGEWVPRGVGVPVFSWTVDGLYEEQVGGEWAFATGTIGACAPSARVLDGRLDLEGDGSPTSGGRFAGYAVKDGELFTTVDGVEVKLNAVIGGVDVRDGRVHLQSNGGLDDDAGRIAGGAIVATGRSNCIIGGDGRDAAFGGPAADRILTGFGSDFVDAGPGANLVRGGPGNNVLFGGPHANTMFGDSGDDALFGGPSADELDGGPGDDYLEGNEGGDVLRGGSGDDVLIGGSSGTAPDVYATAGPGSTVARGWWTTTLESPSGDDTLFGDDGSDLLFGDNVRIATDGTLAFWDGDGASWLALASAPGAPFAGDDELHGGPGENVLMGQLGDDDLFGGAGAEYLFGDLAWFWPTSGEAWLTGAPAWHRVLFPGVAAGPAPAWASDVLQAAGEDHYDRDASDPDGRTHWPGDAPRYDVLLAAPNVGGADHIFAGPGDDHVFAGAGDDYVEGGPGDDYIEGGPGDDELYGHSRAVATGEAQPEGAGGLAAVAGQIFGGGPGTGLLSLDGDPTPGNDIIGGSSAVHPDAADPDGPGAPSGNDLLAGVFDEDVLVGDNVQVTRHTANGGAAWLRDPITGGRARDVVPYDLHRVADGYTVDPAAQGSGALGSADVLAGDETLGGDDLLIGIAGRNRMYGGPGDDYIRGGPGDDYAEGGPGDDWLEGGLGDDDLIGGGSFAADDSARALDTGSTVLGTEGFPSGSNVVLGQGGQIGQGGQNVLTGDNARVVRAEPGADFDVYLATQGRFVGFTTERWVSLLDLGHPLDASVGGEDVLSGGPGNSLLFGQGGDDWATGGDGDDYLEGGPGDDVLFGDRRFGLGPDGAGTGLAFAVLGDRPTITRRGHAVPPFAWPGAARARDAFLNDLALLPAGPTSLALLEGEAGTDGQDDLIGGNSRPALPAGNDTIYGDGGDDFVLGDNAEAIREVSGGAYVRYDERYAPSYAGERTIVREVIEFDVGTSLDGAWRDASGAVEAAAPFGDDFVDGGPGDDTLHGQDGDDELWGSPRDDVGPGGEVHPRGESWGDHLIGGPGDDRLYGGPGHDVLVGDRGAIISLFLADESRRVAFTRNGPPFMKFTGLETGDLWHRVDLYCKEDRSPVASGGVPRFFDHGPDGCNLAGSDGLGDPDNPIIIGSLPNLRYSHHSFGGDDLLRGGVGDTVLYGGGGNDVLQGDTGADILFGGRGSNVLYSGEGEAGVSSTNPADYARDDDREHVDWLFGGRGESTLDYRPRVLAGHQLDAGWADPAARRDPALWFEMTRPYWHPDEVDDATFALLRDHGADLSGVLGSDGVASGALADVAMVPRPQYHQGVTWAYGGWGRKVHQLSVSNNPPDPGDRFMDVIGNFNLFTHCPPHYGSDNISRELRPATDDVVHLMALIAGAGPSLDALRTPGTSGFDQIAFVHPRIDGSIGANTGAAFRDAQLTWGADLPGIEPVDGAGVTPGHRYDDHIACPGGGGVLNN